MYEFNTIIKINEIMSLHIKENENLIVDITNHIVTEKEILFLKKFANKNKILVTDTNWFGGIWTLEDFLKAETAIDNFVHKLNAKDFSPFERYLFAYHFACNRPYIKPPKGSPFQLSRSYVDVLNNGFCVCVGYSTILKRLCDKLGIECAVQGCYAKDKFGNSKMHANNLIYLKDEKYNIDGLFYSDPRMDCINFADTEKKENIWKLNFFALPITDIGKINIQVWNDDTIIEMNDFQSLYYSRNLSFDDEEYLSKFFSKETLQNIMAKKYCKPIDEKILFSALQQLDLDQNLINDIKRSYSKRKELFFTNSKLKISKESDIRKEFINYLKNYLNHTGRKNALSKLDCATFVRYVYGNFFNIDIIKEGIGKSWTGKILTSLQGQLNMIDEKATLQHKLSFIDEKCKKGDILLFHRQSLNEDKTTSENWYPGHCGIYIGDHKYIDSRLTTRGNTEIVNMEEDEYMNTFIGFKNFISFFTCKTIDEKDGDELK